MTTTPARKPSARKAPAKRAMPSKPAGVREPQDHLPPAAQREAAGEETEIVEYGGAKFTIPADIDDWPVRAVQSLNNSKVFDAIELALGPMQWAQLVAVAPTRRQFMEFFELVAERMGFQRRGN